MKSFVVEFWDRPSILAQVENIYLAMIGDFRKVYEADSEDLKRFETRRK